MKSALTALVVVSSLVSCRGDTPPPAPPAVPPTVAAADSRAADVAPAPAAAAEVWAKSLRRSGDAELSVLFEAELAAAEAAGKGVVVMFTADWCTPCRTIKELLADSDTIAAQVTDGRFLYIDVDEWRGPAHRLIPGVNPTGLPVLVSVDRRGNARQEAFGTRMGLLDEQAMGENLARLVKGQPTVRPAYMEDDKQRRDLAVADTRRKKDKTKDRAPFEVDVVSRVVDGDTARWTLNVIIHNNEAPRRWIVLPTHHPEPTAPIVAKGWTKAQLNEHVRAYIRRYATAPRLDIIPVAGWGRVELRGWAVETPADVSQLAMWTLGALEVGGARLTFDKKVAYDLLIRDAADRYERLMDAGDLTLNLKIKARHTVAKP